MVNNKFFYDVGLRRNDTNSPKTKIMFQEECPRFLEDYIEKYGKKNINIIDYGKLIEEKKHIKELLKWQEM